MRKHLEKRPFGKSGRTAKDNVPIYLKVIRCESELDSAASVFSPVVGLGMMLNITTDYSARYIWGGGLCSMVYVMVLYFLQMLCVLYNQGCGNYEWCVWSRVGLRKPINKHRM